MFLQRVSGLKSVMSPINVSLDCTSHVAARALLSAPPVLTPIWRGLLQTVS